MNRLSRGGLWLLAAYAGYRGARALKGRLRGPLRRIRHVVPALMATLDLEAGMHVLAVGSGMLVVPAAQAIGSTGHLTAVSLSQASVEALSEQVVRAELENVTVRRADPRELAVPDETFDRVVMANELGGMLDCKRALATALRVLRPGGQLIVAEDPLHPDFLTERRVLDWALSVGFVLRAREGGSLRYALVFERQPASAGLHAPHESHRMETYG